MISTLAIFGVICMSRPGVSSPAAIPTQLAMILKELAVESAQVDAAGREWERRVVYAPVSIGVQLNINSANHGSLTGFHKLHEGWATDISACGVGLLLANDLPVNHVMAVDLGALIYESSQSFILPIRTVYCQNLLPRTWRIGAAFEFEVMRQKQAA